MVRLDNVKVELNYSGLIVEGFIAGNLDSWSFRSDNIFFRRVCPAGIMYSSDFSSALETPMQFGLFNLIEHKVKVMQTIAEVERRKS